MTMGDLATRLEALHARMSVRKIRGVWYCTVAAMVATVERDGPTMIDAVKYAIESAEYIHARKCWRRGRIP